MFSQEQESVFIVLRDQNNDIVTNGFVYVSNEKGKQILELDAAKLSNTPIRLNTGNYTLKIVSPGFRTFERKIDIYPGIKDFLVKLKVEDINVDVLVEQSTKEKRLDEAFNITLSEEEIALLPELGEEIEQELRRRFGDDAVIQIDGGFGGSQFPPRSQISSIKVVRNAFDSEFHGLTGVVIHIRTIGVTQNMFGAISFVFSDSRLNARNSFDPIRQPEQDRRGTFFLNGPLVKDKTSFNVSVFLDDSFDTRNFIGTNLGTPSISGQRLTRQNISSSFGIKHNLPAKHLLAFNYRPTISTNFYLGPFDLPERGTRSENTEHSFTLSESGILNGRYVNDVSFEFSKGNRSIIPKSDGLTISILDSFNSGSSGRNSISDTTRFRFADNLLFDLRSHSLKIGADVEYLNFRSVSANNLNGSFTFSTIEDFENQNPAIFSQTTGATEVELTQLRTSFYVQDYFRFKKALQLSLGLRYERQNDFGDSNNFSPRFGFAWAPTEDNKFVVRGGAGIFYDWLDTNTLASVLGNDGMQGQNLIVLKPGFPDPFVSGIVAQTTPISISRLAENLVNPRIFTAQAAFEYRLDGITKIDGIYTFRRGQNNFRTRNINAPVDGINPNPNFGRIDLLESSGVSNENSFELKVSSLYKKVSINGSYRAGRITSNFQGAFELPSNNSDIHLDRGPSNIDQTHKINLSFNYSFNENLSITPSYRLESGFPFNVTTGRDDNGDTVFNDRPFGIGRNTERGEWLRQADVSLSWRISPKYFGLSEKFVNRASLNVRVNNVFNTANLTNFVGVQTSPFFSQPTLARQSRRIQVGLSFFFRK